VPAERPRAPKGPLHHNRREEQPGGVYDTCDDALVPASAERLVAELRAFPEPPLKPYNDGPAVVRHIEANLELSRRAEPDARRRVEPAARVPDDGEDPVDAGSVPVP
jgi:hypothetical protein